MPLARSPRSGSARPSCGARCARCAPRSTSTRTPPTRQQIAPLELKAGSEGYPPDLETLVDGVAAANDATGRKLKFLRRDSDRSDDAEQPSGGCARTRTSRIRRSWGGQNVFDVYTTFDGTALDGTKYQ